MTADEFEGVKEKGKPTSMRSCARLNNSTRL